MDRPEHGELQLQPDGSFSYRPEENFNGTDAFTYRVSDGELQSDLVVVEISVAAVNDAPQANGESYSTEEDQALIVEANGVLANDVDVDGDPLTAVLDTPPQHGTLTLNPDGSFSYLPDANFNGTDSFTYLVSDGVAQSELGVVEIVVNPVNDAPVATADEYTVDSGSSLTIEAAGVLANDTDVDGDQLVASLATGPEHGVVELAEDGSFVYTPEAGFSGVDQFSYLTSDGTATAEASVSITVLSTAVAPEVRNDSFTATAGQTLTVDPAAGVLANDSDANGDALNSELFRGPSMGSCNSTMTDHSHTLRTSTLLGSILLFTEPMMAPYPAGWRW